MGWKHHPKNEFTQEIGYLQTINSEPVFVNLLRSPGIDSQPAESIPGLRRRLRIRALMNTCRKVPLQVSFWDDHILHWLLWVLSFYGMSYCFSVARWKTVHRSLSCHKSTLQCTMYIGWRRTVVQPLTVRCVVESVKSLQIVLYIRRERE